MPEAMRARFARVYGLSPSDAALLTASRAKAEYFEQSASAATVIQIPKIANWINGEVSYRLNAENRDFSSIPVKPESLAKLLDRSADGTLSPVSTKQVLDEMWTSAEDPDAIIERRGLRQISDEGALEELVDDVLAANAKQVEDFRAGKEKAFNSLVGQVMKASRGKANPAQVNSILRRKLGK
jgi:aspartyl-tRNA(Asn)/glutamyl-tRNA(Gln) amidotransferase subunit B